MSSEIFLVQIKNIKTNATLNSGLHIFEKTDVQNSQQTASLK